MLAHPGSVSTGHAAQNATTPAWVPQYACAKASLKRIGRRWQHARLDGAGGRAHNRHWGGGCTTMDISGMKHMTAHTVTGSLSS